MNKILVGAVAAVGLGAAIAAAVMALGLVDVGADTPHSPAVYRLLAYAREQAIARSSSAIEAPADLADPERIRRGAGNYDAMCINCHLAPAMPDSEIRKGLYPTPPNLALNAGGAASERDAARRFWIIKHGIKASAMPAWSKGGMEDQAIWDLVAFLQAMPALSPSEYRRLVASSDGHSHGGHDASGEAHAHSPPAAPPAKHDQKPPHEHGGHEHGAHRHQADK